MGDEIYQLASQLRIGGADSPIGARRIALLEQIDKTGSLSAAARTVGMSYKGAWDAVNAMNNLADTTLVTGSTGGIGGGGSCLSDRGRALIHIYRAAAEEQQRFLARLNQRVHHLRDDIDLVGRLTMQSSARNQLFGRVATIETGTVNTEVELDLRGGDRLTAVITQASAETLGLEPGVAVTALIKASWLIVARDAPTPGSLSTRNQLTGTVDSVTTDEVNSEIAIRLPGGATLVAVITRDSAETLALREGEPATALFKASSVILAQAE